MLLILSLFPVEMSSHTYATQQCQCIRTTDRSKSRKSVVFDLLLCEQADVCKATEFGTIYHLHISKISGIFYFLPL